MKGSASSSNGAAGGWVRGSLRASSATRCGGEAAVLEPLIVKIGGSLLARPRWPVLIRSLLEVIGRRPCRLVVGGGAIVDGLRLIDGAAPQPATLVHELAIDAMRLTARLVAAAVDLPLVTRTGADSAAGPAVLDAPAWLAAHAAAAAVLPAGWSVTSDSIAACVAAAAGGRLLLVKSVPPPFCAGHEDPVAAAAAAGWVDEWFPRAAAALAEIGWASPDGL